MSLEVEGRSEIVAADRRHFKPCATRSAREVPENRPRAAAAPVAKVNGAAIRNDPHDALADPASSLSDHRARRRTRAMSRAISGARESGEIGRRAGFRFPFRKE